MSTKREKTRESLLDAAWKRLEAGDEAKLEDVAHDVGVSRQTVYLHFGSRGGMLLALVSYIDEKLGLMERIRVVQAIAEPLARLEAMLRMTATYAPQIHNVAMALVRLGTTDADVRAALDDRMQHRRHGLGQVVKRLSSDGLLRADWSAGEIADALWEASAPSSYELLVVERGWKPARYGDWLVFLARSFLRER